MKGQKVLFSHKDDDWETPQDLFDELNKEFNNFALDLAANKLNSKCGLAYIDNIDMHDNGKFYLAPFLFAWCNPPYSKQRKFVEFSIKYKVPTVFLLPARTDTKLFHELIYKNTEMEIRFLKGRVKFKRGLNSINAIKSKIYDLKNLVTNNVFDDKKLEEIFFNIERLEKSLTSNDAAGFPSMIVIYRPNNE